MKITIKHCAILLPLLSLQVSVASDRPEDVMRKADQAIARALQIDNDVSSSHIEDLLALAAEENPADWLKKEKPNLKVYDRETLLKEQKEFNLNLFNSFNAGISLLSDYLYQATMDKNLNWTKENSYITNQVTGERLDIHTNLALLVSGRDSTSNPTYKVTSFSQIYEIERQKLCLKFTYYLDLLKYWKFRIFPTGAPFSYLEKNAAAIKGQVSYIIQSLASYNDSHAEKLGKTASYSLIEVCQKIYASMSETVTTNISMPKLNGRAPAAIAKKARRAFQHKKTEAENSIAKKTDIFANEFATLLQKFLNLSDHLNQIQSTKDDADLKARKTKRLLKVDYEEFQSLRQRLSIKTKRINSPLDFTRLNSPVDYITEDLLILDASEAISPDVKEAPQPLPQNMSTDAQAKKELKEKGKEEESESTSEEPDQAQDSLTTDPESNEPLYDDAYWRAEHQRHQQRKQELSMVHEAVVLSAYEVSLYTYLQEKIFKTVYRPKVEELKQDLRKLYFNVKPNGTGNGSTYHVSPMSHNPLFSNDLEYANAYFNVHLPAENIPLPYDYFRYLQSGFSNVFGLTLEYINEQLKAYS